MHRKTRASWPPFSDRALIIDAPFDGSFAQEGTNPQRITDNRRLAVLGFHLTTGTNFVGARCTWDSSPHHPKRLRSAPPKSASSATIGSVHTWRQNDRKQSACTKASDNAWRRDCAMIYGVRLVGVRCSAEERGGNSPLLLARITSLAGRTFGVTWMCT
jgi:hypothetical protein